jgi:hypothetical protein
VQHCKGKKIDRVALARRLSEIVYHVWKEELDYFVVLRRGVVRGRQTASHPRETSERLHSALAQPAGQASNASISHTVDARITFPLEVTE